MCGSSGSSATALSPLSETMLAMRTPGSSRPENLGTVDRRRPVQGSVHPGCAPPEAGLTQDLRARRIAKSPVRVCPPPPSESSSSEALSEAIGEGPSDARSTVLLPGSLPELSVRPRFLVDTSGSGRWATLPGRGPGTCRVGGDLNPRASRGPEAVQRRGLRSRWRSWSARGAGWTRSPDGAVLHESNSDASQRSARNPPTSSRRDRRRGPCRSRRPTDPGCGARAVGPKPRRGTWCGPGSSSAARSSPNPRRSRRGRRLAPSCRSTPSGSACSLCHRSSLCPQRKHTGLTM